MTKQYDIWLAMLGHISKWKKAMLLKAYGSGRGVYEAGKDGVKRDFPDFTQKDIEALENRNLEDAARVEEACARCSARVISYNDGDYPALLNEIPDPPTVIYVRGSLPEGHRLHIAMVGRRKASAAGMKNAAEIAYELSKNGVVIVSGMADGIDGSSHKGALDGGSPTVAVLGTAINRCYPAKHAGLMRDIIANGAVISEYPPGVAAFPGNFLLRNRIISGMSHGVFVVEAGLKSGSLVTAKRAVEQNRDVFAAPGPIGTEYYAGTNSLIKEGACMATCAADILREYPDFRFERASKTTEKRKQEDPVLAAIGKIAHLDDIAERLDMDPGEAMAMLTMLEIEGKVRQRPGNYFETI